MVGNRQDEDAVLLQRVDQGKRELAQEAPSDARSDFSSSSCKLENQLLRPSDLGEEPAAQPRGAKFQVTYFEQQLVLRGLEIPNTAHRTSF